MKPLLAPLFLLALLTACQKPAPPPEPAAPTPETRTSWTGRSEVFVEIPPLAQGQKATVVVQVTETGRWRPMTQGSVEVKLQFAGGSTETFRSPEPRAPGNFAVVVTPSRNGPAQLMVQISGPVSDQHALGELKLPTTGQGEEPAGIKFRKEQQWALDFATGIARPGTLRPSIRVPAEVQARAGGEADVMAPLDGRLVLATVPVPGTRVSAGQQLASLQIPAPNLNDLAALELARSEARAALDLARRDRERAARLVEAGAAPAKRLEEARTTEIQQEARLKAAERRLEQSDAGRRGDSVDQSRNLAIRAPINGVITEVHASNGANVKAGERIFQILDPERLYVSAIVPEHEFPNMASLTGGEIELPGLAQPQPLGRLISVGKVVDPQSHTFPVVYEVSGARLAVHQHLYVRLFFTGSRSALIVPQSALVDDAGQPVVFVQTQGDLFERRAVKAGLRMTNEVEILEGLREGERIVLKGAYLVKLAAASSQIPAEGHVH
jgi:RND family efflux transporter MFP subunit